MNEARVRARLRAFIQAAGGNAKVASRLGYHPNGVANWQRRGGALPRTEALAKLHRMGLDLNKLVA